MFSTAEKIETIVESRNSGTMGKFVALDDGAMRVECDGLCFIVRTVRHGWQVSFGPFVCIDGELYVAAQMAVDTANANKGRAIASRH